jgi:hypothetical protein
MNNTEQNTLRTLIVVGFLFLGWFVANVRACDETTRLRVTKELAACTEQLKGCQGTCR